MFSSKQDNHKSDGKGSMDLVDPQQDQARCMGNSRTGVPTNSTKFWLALLFPYFLMKRFSCVLVDSS